jgi:hypothetical protein
MRAHVRVSRPHRTFRVARQVHRPIVRSRNIVYADPSARNRNISEASVPSSAWSGFQPDPYVDYARFLTPEGGILMIYKDLDLRLRQTLWRLFAWTVSTGGAGWYLYRYSPLQSVWLNLACLLAVGALNWFIVRKPVELYRRIEIRPDCLVLEGNEVFWLRFMENGYPSFQPDRDDNQVLGGVYGTRFVEYATIRRFDELDRTPEVIAAHLQDAMKQLWEKAGTVFAHG